MNWMLVAAGLLAAVGVLMVLNALFSALETATLTINRQTLRSQEAAGNTRATVALQLFAQPSRILSGALLGKFITLLLAAGFLKTALRYWLPLVLSPWQLAPQLWWLSSSSLWTFLLLTPVFLVCGEMIPRQWCRTRPNAVLRLSSPIPARLISAWLIPAGWISRGLSRMFGALGLRGWLEPAGLTREDLRAYVEASEETPPASAPGHQRRMIRSILSLNTTLVREVMRPLGKVVAIRLGEMTPAQMLDFARRHSYTRFPVYRERMIDLLGFVNIYDLLSEDLEGKRLEEYLQDALFVPETATVATLLHEFFRQKTQCAIVFDEHGSCSGWVTREDVLEQIVGDLDSESDPAMRLVQKEADGVLQVDPRLDLDDLARLYDIVLEKIHCETVGGYVYSVLGRVPYPGERIYLRRWILEVIEVDRHIIRSVRFIRRPTTLPAALES
jgi:putative hemolysin